jgi:hypothetical protein
MGCMFARHMLLTRQLPPEIQAAPAAAAPRVCRVGYSEPNPNELPAARAGILLAVTIIYQYFETYEKEKAQAGGGVLF